MARWRVGGLRLTVYSTNEHYRPSIACCLSFLIPHSSALSGLSSQFGIMNDSVIILPYDILRSIADQLALDMHTLGLNPQIARNALRALSQTCKLMVPACRRHLFSSIHFDTSTRTRPNFEKLLVLLLKNIEIVSYIQTLYYYVNNVSDDHIDGILEVFLEHSTFLRSINLYAPGYWNAQPLLTRELLERLIALPTITHLRATGFEGYFPYNRLSLCSGLHTLDFSDMKLLTLDYITPVPVRLLPTTHQTPAPKSLLFSGTHYDLLRALMDPTRGPKALGPIMNFNCLQEVDLSIYGQENIEQIKECMLLEMAKGLQEFIIRGE